jgi:DNA-directed RNA polymerase specialized sigma24 family protein
MADPLIQLEAVIERLKKGRPAYGSVGVDILREVVLAEAMQQGNNEAAKTFLKEFRPAIEKILSSLDKNSEEDVDEIINELFVTRDPNLSQRANPPRLAKFNGLAPLTSWLKQVVPNLWRDLKRKEGKWREKGKGKVIPIGEIAPPDPDLSPEEEAEYNDLWQRGVDLIVMQFLELFGSIEDRDELLAWLMVHLDGALQKDVANRLCVKVVPSTISRYLVRVEKKVNEAFEKNNRLASVVDAVYLAPEPIRRSIAQRIVQALERETRTIRDSACSKEPGESSGIDPGLLRNTRSS